MKGLDIGLNSATDAYVFNSVIVFIFIEFLFELRYLFLCRYNRNTEKICCCFDDFNGIREHSNIKLKFRNQFFNLRSIS